MQTNRVKRYTLEFDEVKTYYLALVFVVGNILLPQLCHLIPQGGLIFLPIYLFTLIGSYKYGWRVGLLTAIISPIANHMLFGMPVADVLLIILVKSLLLSFAASYAAQYFKRDSILTFVAIVAAYQGVGTLIEWAMVKDLLVALQDVRMGLPGILIQVFGGYYIVNRLLR